jgi:hypothetical protein
MDAYHYCGVGDCDKAKRRSTAYACCQRCHLPIALFARVRRWREAAKKYEAIIALGRRADVRQVQIVERATLAPARARGRRALE